MIHVGITGQMQAAARAYEADVLARLPARPNPTGLEAPRRYYVGRLAELSFEQMCRDLGVAFRWLGNADGLSDPGADYEIAGDLVQVKYVPPSGWRFMQNRNEAQRAAYRAALYVPIQPNQRETRAAVRSYFTRAQVEAMPVQKGDYGAPFHWAFLAAGAPIEELVERWPKVVTQPRMAL